MNRQISGTRVSIAQRIREMPMNAADRDAVLDCFLATERTVNGLAKMIEALRRLVVNSAAPVKHASNLTPMSSSRIATP